MHSKMNNNNNNTSCSPNVFLNESNQISDHNHHHQIDPTENLMAINYNENKNQKLENKIETANSTKNVIENNDIHVKESCENEINFKRISEKNKFNEDDQEDQDNCNQQENCDLLQKRNNNSYIQPNKKFKKTPSPIPNLTSDSNLINNSSTTNKMMITPGVSTNDYLYTQTSNSNSAMTPIINNNQPNYFINHQPLINGASGSTGGSTSSSTSSPSSHQSQSSSPLNNQLNSATFTLLSASNSTQSTLNNENQASFNHYDPSSSSYNNLINIIHHPIINTSQSTFTYLNGPTSSSTASSSTNVENSLLSINNLDNNSNHRSLNSNNHSKELAAKSYLYETSNHSEPSQNFILANNKLKLNKKDPIIDYDIDLAESIEFELGLKKQNGPRKNSWGNLSYAELITRAIESSLEQRLTLSQIYDWIVKYVPYFKEKYDRTSSAGWKNSIRHNLSLHNRFIRVQNESSGKSSWWMINPDISKYTIGNTTNLVPNKTSSNRSPSILNNDYLENRNDSIVRMDINSYCEEMNKNNNSKIVENSSIIPNLNNKTATNQLKKFNSLYEGNNLTYLNDNKFKNKQNSNSNYNNQNRISNSLNLGKSGLVLANQSKNSNSAKSSKTKSSNSSKSGKIKVSNNNNNNMKDDNSIKSNELENNNQLSSTSTYSNLTSTNNPVPLSSATNNKKFNNRINYSEVTNNVMHQNNNLYTTMNCSNGIQNILVDSPVSINSTSSSSSSSSISSSTSTPPPTFYQPNQISSSSILRAALQKPGGLSTPPTPTATPNQTVNNNINSYTSNFTNQRSNNKCQNGTNNALTMNNNTNTIVYPLNYQNTQCFNFNNQLDYSGAYNAANKQHQSFFSGQPAQQNINQYNSNPNNNNNGDNPFYPQPIPSSAASPSSSSSSSTSTSKLISSPTNYQLQNKQTPIKNAKSPQMFHSLTQANSSLTNYQSQIINPSSCQFYSNEYYPQQSLNNIGAYQNFNNQNLYNSHNQHPLIHNNAINSSNRTSLVATNSSNPSSSSPLYYDLNQHISIQSNYNSNPAPNTLTNGNTTNCTLQSLNATNLTSSSMDEFSFQDLITNSNNNYVYNSSSTSTNTNNSTPTPIKCFFN